MELVDACLLKLIIFFLIQNILLNQVVLQYILIVSKFRPLN